MTVTLLFDHATMTGVISDPRHQFLLGLEANFRLAVGSPVVVDEPNFPIVELRQWLDWWLSQGADLDFVYTSIEAEETGLIVFRQSTGSDWIVDSAWSSLSAAPTVDYSTLIAACQRYVHDVDEWVAAQYGVDLGQLLGNLR